MLGYSLNNGHEKRIMNKTQAKGLSMADSEIKKRGGFLLPLKELKKRSASFPRGSFHSAEYQEQLKEIFHAAQADYLDVSTRRQALQHGVLRNYIWIANLVFALDIFLLSDKFTSSPLWINSGGIVFKSLVYLSMVFSGWAFLYGIDAMRGRQKNTLPCNSYMDIAGRSFEDCKQETPDYSAYAEMIMGFDTAIADNRSIVEKKAEKLRFLSVLLCISALSMFASLIPWVKLAQFF